TCRNNLRNCTLAVLNFEAANRQYPGYREPMEVLLPGDNKAAKIPVSWVVMVLPYLERKDIYALWRNLTGVTAANISWPPSVYIDILICPSSPPLSMEGTPCAYVVNSGMADVAQLQPEPIAPTPSDVRANGVFLNHYPQQPGEMSPTPFCSRINKPPIEY